MYFTICIPTYNRENTIRRTLESLKIQTFKDFEVIVVDDGSKDKTSKIVEDYKNHFSLKYIYKENGGKHSALNVGIKESKGIFFIILDSDDWLLEDALENFHHYCEKIVDNKSYCGVLAKCMNYKTGEIIGDKVPEGNEDISYIDMHYVFPFKNIYLGDCCECNKTEILKQYSFPERVNMKFVPEALVFDKIGVNHKLLCTNTIVRNTEYLSNGMTLDKNFKQKHYLGYLYYYISRIEDIIPNTNLGIKAKVNAWWRYWQTVKMDKHKEGPRVEKVTMFGRLIYVLQPIINIIFNIKYK